MKKYYLLLILLTVSLQVYCKTIRGEVVDSLGLPVPFSTIPDFITFLCHHIAQIENQ